MKVTAGATLKTGRLCLGLPSATLALLLLAGCATASPAPLPTPASAAGAEAGGSSSGSSSTATGKPKDATASPASATPGEPESAETSSELTPEGTAAGESDEETLPAEEVEPSPLDELSENPPEVSASEMA